MIENEIINNNNLLLNHLFNYIIILIVSFLKIWGSEFLIIILVSSANKIGLDISDIVLGRSIIYVKETIRDQVWSLEELHV
jgi:hypothetical protein